jgi:MFS transporter, MHS family, proline/betaine transporter
MSMSKNVSLRALAAASIGNFGEVYDFGLFGFSVPVLSTHFFPSNDPFIAVLNTFAIFAVAFFARPFGGILFGVMADKYGRVKVLGTTVVLMAAGTGLIGVLPTYAAVGLAAPIALVLCRIVQGVSIGGEATNSSTYILECAPEDRRGWWQGVIWFWCYCPSTFTALFVLTAQAAAGSSAYSDWAWRVPFLAGVLVGIVGFWLRRNLDDPEEFKQAVREARIRSPLRDAVSLGLKAMIQVFLMTSVAAVGVFLLLGFMYTFLVRQVGLSSLLALTSNAVAILILGIFVAIAGALSDRIGRKPILNLGAAWIALGSYPAMRLAASGSFGGALAGQSLLAIGIGIYCGAAFVTMPSLFPTAYRGTAYGISYQFALAIFGGTSPFVCTWLVHAFGSPIAPGIYMALMGLLSLIVVQFVPETRWTSLRRSTGTTPVDEPALMSS